MNPHIRVELPQQQWNDVTRETGDPMRSRPVLPEGKGFVSVGVPHDP